MHTRFENRQIPYDSFLSRNLSFYTHIHSHVELVVVREGELSITVDDHYRLLSKGDVAIIFPNTVHSYHTASESLIFLLIFTPNLVGEYSHVFSTMQPTDPFQNASKIHPDIYWGLNRLQAATVQPITAQLRKGYLLVLLGKLLESIPLEKPPVHQDIDLLHRLLIYMDENFLEPLSLDKVASDLAVSKYHLSRQFTQRIGVGFHAYLGALRVGYARHLLNSGSYSIAEVCYESGFESMTTFYRAFRANLGMTPGEYIKEANNTQK